MLKFMKPLICAVSFFACQPAYSSDLQTPFSGSDTLLIKDLLPEKIRELESLKVKSNKTLETGEFNILVTFELPEKENAAFSFQVTNYPNVITEIKAAFFSSKQIVKSMGENAASIVDMNYGEDWNCLGTASGKVSICLWNEKLTTQIKPNDTDNTPVTYQEIKEIMLSLPNETITEFVN